MSDKSGNIRPDPDPDSESGTSLVTSKTSFGKTIAFSKKICLIRLPSKISRVLIFSLTFYKINIVIKYYF